METISLTLCKIHEQSLLLLLGEHPERNMEIITAGNQGGKFTRRGNGRRDGDRRKQGKHKKNDEKKQKKTHTQYKF